MRAASTPPARADDRRRRAPSAGEREHPQCEDDGQARRARPRRARPGRVERTNAAAPTSASVRRDDHAAQGASATRRSSPSAPRTATSQVRVVAQGRRRLAEQDSRITTTEPSRPKTRHQIRIVALVAAGPRTPPLPHPRSAAGYGTVRGAGRRGAASRRCRPGARRRRYARPASRRPRGRARRAREAAAVGPRLSGGRPARGAPLGDRQVHDRRGEAERDRKPPHHVVGAGRLVDAPPSQTPTNAPTWCERNTKPNSIPTWRVPNISATSPDVSGTVESHSRPIAAENSEHGHGRGRAQHEQQERDARARSRCRTAAAACSCAPPSTPAV